jgi:S1-C subfamily serine protease
MGRRLSVAVFVLLLLTSEARAGPAPATLAAGENRASGQDVRIGSAADYIRTLNQAVPISGIGIYVRDGRTELIDGHEVNGVEVIDAAAESPADSFEVQSCRMAARTALARGRGFVATILRLVIPLLRAIDHNSIFDDRDLIFAVDGARVRNILELADRVQSLARGDRIYLTLARRGQRVQICVTASP